MFLITKCVFVSVYKVILKGKYNLLGYYYNYNSKLFVKITLMNINSRTSTIYKFDS